MPVRTLKKFLDENGVKYVSISHSCAYTAQEIAASSHVSGKEFAKTVMIMVDGVMAMAVLTASCRIDVIRLSEELDGAAVILADELAFKDSFSDCELGAMPPFGPLYGMTVYADRMLADDDEIAFNAGSHAEIIRMSYNDFSRLARPQILNFGVACH